jgi:hypothetical protein
MANRSYSASAQQIPAYASSGPHALVPVPRRRVSFWRDVYNGAVLGDFAREKRLGGALAQIVLSFTPGVGTICATRDCVADLRYRDGLGFFLNLLALVPVFGGFSKTLDVIIGLWHARHVLRKRHQPQAYYLPTSAVPTQPMPQPLPQRQSYPPPPSHAPSHPPRTTRR